MASREDLVSSGGSVFSSELLKTFLHQARYVYSYSNNWSLEMFDKLRYFFLIWCSEEDLERALGAYAKQSHSSTAVFLDSSSSFKPELTTPTSSAPPTSGSARTRAVLKVSASQQVFTRKESDTTKSDIKRQESSISVQSIESTKEQNLPSSSAAPARYAWLKEHAVEDDSLTSALPKYSKDMLESSDLPLSSKASLEKLTQSLQSVGRVSSSTGCRGRMRTASATARLAPQKRSLSVQSLASTTSSVDSGILL